jgi:hypothetical protein
LASSAVLYFATNAFSYSALAARAKSPGMIKSVVIKSSDFMKESENVSDEGTSRNREDMERHFSFRRRIYPRAVRQYDL